MGYFFEVEVQARVGVDFGYFIYSLINVVDGYIQLGQFQCVIGLFLECQCIVDQIGFFYFRGDVVKLFFKVYQELGDYVNVLVAYQESIVIVDSFFKVENCVVIQEIWIWYEME